jgi:hypothetical protein
VVETPGKSAVADPKPWRSTDVQVERWVIPAWRTELVTVVMVLEEMSVGVIGLSSKVIAGSLRKLFKQCGS